MCLNNGMRDPVNLTRVVLLAIHFDDNINALLRVLELRSLWVMVDQL